MALALRSSRFAATQAHLRSLFASAWFAREDGNPGSLVSADGLASLVWCLGAGGEPLPDVPGVPVAVVARAGSTSVFVDAWTVRRERMEAPPRRYFRYSYTLRLFGDEHFGRDVDIPSIPITYNIQTSGVTGTRGRDQLYLLPALPVRMMSVVPE